MDSRTNTSHSAFSRPLSQPALRDPRHAPIPPPPYTLQTPVRTAHHLNHDPFLQRRNDYEESWQEQSKPTSQAAFSLGTYAASAPRDALTTATENRERVQENWRFADGRMDRYRSQSGDGKQFMPDYICFFSLHIKSSVHLCSFALLPSDFPPSIHCSHLPSHTYTPMYRNLWVESRFEAIQYRVYGHRSGSWHWAPSNCR